MYQPLLDKYIGRGEASEEWTSTLKSLQYFAADELRTLVCGYNEQVYYEVGDGQCCVQG